MPNDKPWPWLKSDLNHDNLARWENVKFKDGIVSGLGVLSDGTLPLGAFVVNGHFWAEDTNVSSAFDFSPLLNQGSQSVNKLYAQYTYTATDPHAQVVYGYATTVPSNAIQLGIITVPASTSAITQGMIDTSDASVDLSNRALAEKALPASDSKIPTQDEKDALEGYGGTAPSTTNRFATQADVGGGGGDNLGNHTATQDIDFNNNKGIQCLDPVNALDVANRQFVLANIGGQNISSSVESLRRHQLEMMLRLEGMTNSPYPDNFGEPFFRTEFDNIASFVSDAGRQVFQSDHDFKKLTARIVSLKEAERGRIDTRLQLPQQRYFGEVDRYIDVPDIGDKPHAITYSPDTQKIYMITYGTQVDDTILHAIDPVTLQIEASWNFDEASFSRWNGTASGIAFGAGQLFLMEYDDVNTGAVCIRFRLEALPPAGIKISKWNVDAIESANSVDGGTSEVFMDITYDSQLSLLWSMKKIAASDHKLVRLNADFIENGTLEEGGADVTTSTIDTSINGIDFDGDFVWFTGDTWTGRMGTNGTVNAKFKKYGKTGICRVVDSGLPTADGHLFNTDEDSNTLRVIAVRNTLSLPASANYKPIHTAAIISSVDNGAKTVTVTKLDGAAAAFATNEFKSFHMRVSNVWWKVASNTSNIITLDTSLDISGLSGTVELGIAKRNYVTNVTTSGTKIHSYEGGTDNVAITSSGFMFEKDTEIGGAGIELGTITTPGDIELRIESDTNGSPSGTLVDANATTTIASGSLVADSWNSKAFPDVFTLTKNTIYHLVINSAATADVKGHTGGNNEYDTQSNTLNFRLYNSAKLSTNKIAGVAVNNKKLYIGYQEASGTSVFQPDGSSGIDTFAVEGVPTANYGTDDLLKLGFDGQSWTPKTSGSTKRNSYTVAEYNGKMYIFGGWNGSVYLNDVWEYDIVGDSWTQKTSGATVRQDTSAVVYNGKMYIFGGWNGGQLNDVWEYDIAGDSWTPKTSGATVRNSHSAVVYNGKMYVFGGSAGAFKNDVWEYDIVGDSWTQKTSGATVRRNHSAVVYNSKMYIFGGWEGGSVYLNDVWEYDIVGDSWTQKTSGATVRDDNAEVVYNGKMYIFGGWNGGPLNDVWEYDIAGDSWTPKTSGPAAAGGGVSAVVYNGKMYVFEGWNDLEMWEYTLPVISKSRIPLKFDLTGLPASAVSAKIGLYLQSANSASKTVDLYNITQAFVEGEAGWDMYQKTVVTGTQTENFTVGAGASDKLLFTVDGGSQQTVTLTAGTRTTAQIATDINAVFSGLAADDGSGKVKLTANKTIDIATIANDAYTVLGFTVATTSTAWATAGGDYDVTPRDSATITDAVGFVEFDITDLYNEWKAATTTNNGVMIKFNNEALLDNFIDFVSSDNTTAAQRPKLTVDAFATQENIGVMIKDKLVNVGFGGSTTQYIQVIGNLAFVALADKIKILDSADNSEIQVIDNTTFPRITSTIIKDMVVKELVVDVFSKRIDRFLVVTCDNGVTIINMTTGASYPIMNYELESNGATCKEAKVTDNGYLIIVTEDSSGNDQIDIFGDISKIYTSYTNKQWSIQTGFKKTLQGPTSSGVLLSDTVSGISSITKVDALRDYDTSLILIANGQSLLEYNVTKDTLATIDSSGSMTCNDVAYHQGSIYAIFAGSGNNELRQYDAFLKRIISIAGKTTNFNSLLSFELGQDFVQLLVEEDKIMATTSAGLEIIDVAMRDTNAFGDAEWYSELLNDANGIARATVLLKGITMAREFVSFGATAARGAASITVTHGFAGPLISAGDTLILFSTSGASAGSGENILVASSYDEASTTIPFAESTMDENIDDTSSTITLADKAVVDAMPTQGVIKIDSEEIAYNGKSGAVVLVSARGVNGTTPAAHNLGATVNTVLRFAYTTDDPIVFQVNKKQVDKLIDVRVTESSDGVSFVEGAQVLIEDINTGYYTEAARSDYQYGQLKIGIKRTDYEEDSVSVNGAAMYWENY